MRAVLLLAAALGLAGCGGQEEPKAAAARADPPAVAELLCGDDGPDLRTPVVRSQPDGIHVLIRNETDHDVWFDYDVTAGTTGGGGWLVEGRSSEDVIPLAATELSIGCASEAIDRVDLQVVDPGDKLKSADLECERADVRFVHPPEDIRGRDPVEVARRFLTGRGLRATDRVEPAAPVAGKLPVVRVVREGRVVAAVQLDNAKPLHTVGSVSTCFGFAD